MLLEGIDNLHQVLGKYKAPHKKYKMDPEISYRNRWCPAASILCVNHKQIDADLNAVKIGKLADLHPMIQGINNIVFKQYIEQVMQNSWSQTIGCGAKGSRRPWIRKMYFKLGPN